VIQNKTTDQMFLVEDNQTPRGLIFSAWPHQDEFHCSFSH